MKSIIRKAIPTSIRKKAMDMVYGKYIDETDVIFQVYSKADPSVMIDVGAHVGNSLLSFAKNGWEIYAFEPDKKNRAKLVKAIADLPNVHLDVRAVSDQDDQEVPFYSSDVSTGISGLSSFHPTHKPTDIVKTVTLKTFCNNNNVDNVTFLKIDTEGFDLFVLKGFDWENKKHPEVIEAEFENNKTKPLGYTFFEQAEFLKQKNYKLLVSEWYPIVEYGRRHKWKRFVKDYSMITDPDAWGNIIAIKEEKYQALIEVAKKIGPVE